MSRDDPLFLVRVVQGHIKANGDWNINDWRDVAEQLARQVEKLVQGEHK